MYIPLGSQVNVQWLNVEFDLNGKNHVANIKLCLE